MVMVSAVLTMASCKPTVPSRYIQPDDMEDLLYDFHVAQAMADESGKNLEELAGKGNWLNGRRLKSNASEPDISEWLSELGLNR